MKRSTDRILTTHVGSLIRPPELQAMLRARQKGEGYDEQAYDRQLTASVEDIVRQQAATGRLDQLPDQRRLVRREIVQHHHLAGPKRPDQ